MATGEETGRAAKGGLGRFFAARWNGEIALERLFWRDALLTGTAINIVTTIASLALFVAKAPAAVAVTVYLAPLPYNLFLAFSVWRTAERQRSGATALFYQMAVIAWLIVAILI
ncbi:hypothetical protein RB623_07890 [Mesorhizobium sp. LHD-90]|uniref:hypothetical protein n=1 Tax=Mesorhizobium sp. LHD-90 TaxID=3071414 RepID=UPI0027E19777|nr:hypothetical protein [Mesorhizobium sp. LHD-90]MDQ6433965.1 hypothetical protein [Mesorhizobium sp. LHD-90]